MRYGGRTRSATNDSTVADAGFSISRLVFKSCLHLQFPRHNSKQFSSTEGLEMRRFILFAAVISLGLAFSLDANADSGPKNSAATPAAETKQTTKLVTVTYPVADLVVPIAYNLDAAKPKEATQEAALIRLICATVAPNCWEKVIAPDKADQQTAIEFYPLGMGLVVRQTPQAHAEIAALIASLRRLQDIQVAMDIRMISVPTDLAPKILGPVDATGKTLLTLLKDEAEVKDMMETALRDSRTQGLHTPKVTVFNGQRSSIHVGETRHYLTGVGFNGVKGQVTTSPNLRPIQTGVHMTVCPAVSPERECVLLDLKWENSTIIEPVGLMPLQFLIPGYKDEKITEKNGESINVQMFVQQPILDIQHVETKVGITAGKTAVIEVARGQRKTKVEDTSLTATLLDWAGIRENVSYTTDACTTILLVTPRIIVTEERSRFQLGKKGGSLRPQGN